MGSGKLGLSDVQSVRQQLDQVEADYRKLENSIREKQSSGQAVPESDYQQLFVMDKQRGQLRAQIESEEHAVPQQASERKLIRTEVNADEIAAVVSHWTVYLSAA